MIDYEKLAAAIVWQAVKDYDYALACIPPTVRYKNTRLNHYNMRRDVEKYIGSELYFTHTQIEPLLIIRRAMVKKRARVLREFDAKVLNGRKPPREKWHTWQKKEINKKRSYRCLKPLYYFRPER